MAEQKRRLNVHPLLIMLSMILLAALLTHVLPSGKFDRIDGKVVADSYHSVAKISGADAFFSFTAPKESDEVAKSAGIVSVFMSVPAGIAKSADLIFMVMFVGGIFGLLHATGAVDAGIDRLLHLTTGNIYLLTAILMFALGSGATFLGLFSEYIAVVPIVLTLGQKLKWPNIVSVAVVFIPASVGYAASITNPIVLAVAQPLAHVPLFSGIVPRAAIFFVSITVSIIYMMIYLRRFPSGEYTPAVSKLTARHSAILSLLVVGTTVLVVGTLIWNWGIQEHSALFVAWALALALASRMGANGAAEAFLDGMKSMMLPCMMIGLAGSMGIILQSSQILDSVVQGFASIVEGQSAGLVAIGIILAEMVLDILINSTSAKAAISLPILTPIAQLAGIGGNVSVSALTLGGSLTNMIVPTSAVLLAFLAAGKVNYVDWVKFIAPLFAILCLIAFSAVYLMAVFGL